MPFHTSPLHTSPLPTSPIHTSPLAGEPRVRDAAIAESAELPAECTAPRLRQHLARSRAARHALPPRPRAADQPVARGRRPERRACVAGLARVHQGPRMLYNPPPLKPASHQARLIRLAAILSLAARRIPRPLPSRPSLAPCAPPPVTRRRLSPSPPRSSRLRSPRQSTSTRYGSSPASCAPAASSPTGRTRARVPTNHPTSPRRPVQSRRARPRRRTPRRSGPRGGRRHGRGRSGCCAGCS